MSAAEKLPDTPIGILAENYSEVLGLQTALGRSEPDINLIPRIFRRIIKEGCWQDFLTPEERRIRWNAADFRAFLTSKRPEGCETSLYVIEQILRGTDIWDEFQEMIRGEPGGANNPDGLGGWSHKRLVNRDSMTVDKIDPSIIPFDPATPAAPIRQRDYSREAPTGTSTSYSVRRLKKSGRDDLLEKVKTGEMSVYAASCEAGFQRRKITLPLDPMLASRLIVKHFHGDDLATLLREAANHAGFELIAREEYEHAGS